MTRIMVGGVGGSRDKTSYYIKRNVCSLCVNGDSVTGRVSVGSTVSNNGVYLAATHLGSVRQAWHLDTT